jgi:hypothetical protein
MQEKRTRQMKDQNGTTIKSGDFLQVDDDICQVGFATKYQAQVTTLQLTPAVYTVYGFAWQQSCVIRNRGDFTPLTYPHMTDDELANRMAFLNELCPDLS